LQEFTVKIKLLLKVKVSYFFHKIEKAIKSHQWKKSSSLMQNQFLNYKNYLTTFVKNGCITLALSLLLCFCISCASIPNIDAGFVASSDKNSDGSIRQRAVGPLIEHQETSDGKTFDAVRPFYSSVHDTQTDRAVFDVLWPLCTIKTSKEENSGRILTGIWRNWISTNDTKQSLLWIFPFLFTGKDADGRNYFALFPLGGTINKILGKETIQFVLFPLYMKTKDKECTEHNILWPVVAWTESNDTNRYTFRIFPFYGESRRIGQKNSFVMWPLWTSVQYQKPAPHEGSGFLLFPFFGRVHLENQEMWWILPPFFKIAHGKMGSEVNAPWPFIQWRDGKASRLYVWPLWGKHTEGNSWSAFVLWPVGWLNKSDYGRSEIHRYYFLPFIYYEATIKKKESSNPGLKKTSSNVTPVDSDVHSQTASDDATSVSSRYFKLWPLFSYRREEDISQTRILAFWPLKHTPAVERNLSPLWTLFSTEQSEKGGETEFLWGLFRHRWQVNGTRSTCLFPLFNIYSDKDANGWDILGGFLGYRREGLQKKYKLLYFIQW
jgi:hypothetical protein